MLECRRRDLLALASFFLFFFLYFNIHFLHSNSSKALEDLYWEEGQPGQHRERIKDGRPKKQAVDSFDATSPANETLGVSLLHLLVGYSQRRDLRF